jgi:hypothetical protein
VIADQLVKRFRFCYRIWKVITLFTKAGLDPILKQMNAVHVVPPSFFELYFSVSLPPAHRFPKWFSFRTNVLCAFIISAFWKDMLCQRCTKLAFLINKPRTPYFRCGGNCLLRFKALRVLVWGRCGGRPLKTSVRAVVIPSEYIGPCLPITRQKPSQLALCSVQPILTHFDRVHNKKGKFW